MSTYPDAAAIERENDRVDAERVATRRKWERFREWTDVSEEESDAYEREPR